MGQRLKRWESPRREGRNDKGKGGSARQRQRRKQFQRLRQRLKNQSSPSSTHPIIKQPEGKQDASPLWFYIYPGGLRSRQFVSEYSGSHWGESGGVGVNPPRRGLAPCTPCIPLNLKSL
jgi:hypothetical protein